MRRNEPVRAWSRAPGRGDIVRLAVAALLVLAPLTHGCSDPSERSDALVVFAASSLTNAIEDINQAFERERPGRRVMVSFAGTQTLRTQLELGARADVLVAADSVHPAALEGRGILETPVTVARNRLALVVPRDNPSGITSLGDLPKARRLVLGTHESPVGRAARQMLLKASKELPAGFQEATLGAVVSYESNTRLVRSRVELGDADAAIIYRTDARARGSLLTLEIPRHLTVETPCVAGIRRGSERRDLAADWLDFVLGDTGQKILSAHGFLVTP